MVAAFLHGWKMELVLLLVFPAIAISFHLKKRAIVHHQQNHHRLMQPANNVSVVMLCLYSASAMRHVKFGMVYAIHQHSNRRV